MTRRVLASWVTMFVAVAGSTVPANGATAEVALSALKAERPNVRIYKQGAHVTRLYGTPLAVGASAVESAETFRIAHAQVFGVAPEDLVPVNGLRGAPAGQPLLFVPATGEYRFRLFRYSQQRGGVPVYGADLRLVVRDAGDFPVVLAASTLRDIGDFAPQPASPAVDFDPATDAATSMERFSAPRTVIWAGTEKADAAPRIAVTFVGELGQARDGTYEKWQFVCDAQTGEVLHREDLIVFQDVTGNVTGNATEGYKGAHCAPEVPTPMPYAYVKISGGNSAYADSNGDFTIANSGSTSVTVRSYIRGAHFSVYNEAGLDPILEQSVLPPGPADFLHNSANTSEFERACVNAYVHANDVRDWILRYDPLYPSIATQAGFVIFVNHADGEGFCPGNAWYDGEALHFCREVAAKDVANTAFGSVVQHEYGHHVVAMGGSGQEEYGEGMADCVAALIADDPHLACGFYYNDCVRFLRDADNTCQFSATSCSSCGSYPHTCGRLLSGCVWSLRTNLAANYPSTYMDIIVPLTLASVQVHSGSSILPSISTDFLTLDDDDGDLTNGTPHESEIIAAFAAHNMLPGPPPDNDACADALPVCPGVPVSGSTVDASNDGTASCGTSDGSPDVWYAYTPATSGTATFGLCNGTSYDAVLSVHTGCPGNLNNQTGCDDDFCGSGGAALVTQSVSAGVTYYVRVTGYSSSAGLYSLEVTGPDCAPPATCADGIQNQGEERIDCGGPCSACDCLADVACDDGLFCTGNEICDAFGHCQFGATPCSVAEWCYDAAQNCVLYGNGDMDADGDIDLEDFHAFQECFGQLGLGPCSPGKMAGEGVIGLDDFVSFQAAITGP